MPDSNSTTIKPTLDVFAVDHFVRVAQKGAIRGASHGERIASQLAKALNTVREDICLLDSSCVQGACDLIKLVAGPWETDEQQQAAFELLARAANEKT